ncbi:hypothetical protein LCI18_006716 [Fusarium solani-melongenae]|uniref:Uncharacterized protein n=1 Tax=Fusarium solani subsp. cucurbitae TaxID=2747967 RepID=A0ACD3Z4L2_FUSSC|nr:hypothetical protein LCI18_006716 [Fusarium solani-melongenae]
MAESLYIAASVAGLGTQTQEIIGVLSKLRLSYVDRGLLDRVWLIQKIISRSADVIPQALENELFRKHHKETMDLCFSKCAHLIPQLEKQIHKATKNRVRAFLLDQHIVEILRHLEIWSTLLSEEMNEWKLNHLHRMIEDGFKLQDAMIDKSHFYLAETADMIKHLIGRCHPDTIPMGMPCNENATGSMQEETQGSLEPGIRDDARRSAESSDAAMTVVAPASTTYQSRLGQGLEQVSERLRELNTSGTDPPFLFPFVIVPDDPQAPSSAPFRVKLDSGCDLNWISTRILKRAGLEDKQKEAKSDRAWLGFSSGEELILPQGTITLTWYSVNASYTHRHEFLVHDQVPFDVVLGSEFIIEEGWKKSFNDPVLALRYSDLSDDQLREIHHKARQNKDATDAQRQAEREMRSKDRQARRQFGLSRTGTPRSLLSPAGSQPLSHRISRATIAGHPSTARSPLSAQALSMTSESHSILEPSEPLSTTSTQQASVLSDDLEGAPAVPSVSIVDAETDLGTAGRV